jgi:hypothetical protein
MVEVIVVHGKGIERIVFERLELVAVVAVQPVFGGEPQEAIVVLANRRHKTLR